MKMAVMPMLIKTTKILAPRSSHFILRPTMKLKVRIRTRQRKRLRRKKNARQCTTAQTWAFAAALRTISITRLV